MFHLGALSGLITGIETPGWTSVDDYPWQIIGLCQYGAEEGRTEEQPLMVRPDAVSISTIHGVKGLEFAAVFLADVNARRFPSGYAKRKPNLPLDGKIVREIRSEEHTSELQSQSNLVCRLLLEKKNTGTLALAITAC